MYNKKNMSFTPCSSVSIVNFEEGNAGGVGGVATEVIQNDR